MFSASRIAGASSTAHGIGGMLGCPGRNFDDCDSGAGSGGDSVGTGASGDGVRLCEEMDSPGA